MLSFKKWKEKMTEQANAGSKMISTKQGEIQYTDIGEGIPVIHSHGSPSGCDVGPRLFSFMTKYGIHFITPSRPGFLKTPLSIGPTTEKQADLFISLMDALEIEQAILHAWSAGGPPAIVAAKKYPDRFKALIIYSAVTHKWEHKITTFEKMMMSDPGLWIFTLMQSFMKKSFRKQTCKAMGLDYNYLKDKPESVKQIDILFEFMAPASLRNPGSWNDINQYRKINDLGMENISIPTLITHSPTDNQLPISNGELPAKLIPNAKFINFEHGGHVPLIDDRADYLNDEILKFIKTSFGQD